MPFWGLIKLSFRRQLTYRAAAFAGLVTNFFFGALRASVMVALYGQREEVMGISIQSAVTYTGITQAIIGFLSLFSWFELMYTIYNGTIATDLLKPMGYYRYWLAQDFGRAIAQFLLRTVPIMIGYSVFFKVTYPKSLSQWLSIFLAIGLAWLLSFSFRFLINLAAFWIPNATGIARFSFIFLWFSSGFLMPLRFFPDWFVHLCNLTPFPYMVNTIVEVYLGLLNGAELVYALTAQCIWIVILTLLGQVTLRAGVKRLVILGG